MSTAAEKRLEALAFLRTASDERQELAKLKPIAIMADPNEVKRRLDRAFDSLIKAVWILADNLSGEGGTNGK